MGMRGISIGLSTPIALIGDIASGIASDRQRLGPVQRERTRSIHIIKGKLFSQPLATIRPLQHIAVRIPDMTYVLQVRGRARAAFGAITSLVPGAVNTTIDPFILSLQFGGKPNRPPLGLRLSRKFTDGIKDNFKLLIISAL